MPNPLISIISPFKNTEQYLGECLDSILNQTYTNWELLIVDDNSTDASYNLVNTYAEKDERVKLLKNDREGIIPALQTGFKHSKGEYITRMDSDDIMPPNKLDVLLNNLLKCDKQHVATGLVKYFPDDFVKEGFKSYETWLNKLTITASNFSEIYKECVIASPCWMIHRDDFNTCGGFTPNNYPEDYDLVFRFYKHKFKCIPCNEVLHLWRDYSSRTSRTHHHYAENSFLELKLRYFLELDYDNNRPLAIWGAGKKGKLLAQELIKRDVSFYWICDNPKKIGKDIYGKMLQSFDSLKNINNPQGIITVANKEAQTSIKTYMEQLQMKPMIDYFFFC